MSSAREGTRIEKIAPKKKKCRNWLPFSSQNRGFRGYHIIVSTARCWPLFRRRLSTSVPCLFGGAPLRSYAVLP
jgi:hypothetical protein